MPNVASFSGLSILDCFVYLRLMCPMLLVSLDYPFLIGLCVFLLFAQCCQFRWIPLLFSPTFTYIVYGQNRSTLKVYHQWCRPSKSTNNEEIFHFRCNALTFTLIKSHKCCSNLRLKHYNKNCVSIVMRLYCFINS